MAMMSAPFDQNQAALMALAGDQAASDPRLAAILQYISQAQSAEVADDTDVDHGKSAALRDELRSLRRENRRLRELNDALLAHTEFLAEGIGACPLCWGEDPDCQECGGDGGPGTFVPDRQAFNEFVRPAVETLRAYIASRRDGKSPEPKTTKATNASAKKVKQSPDSKED